MALRDLRSEIRLAMPVWDAPTRLFHAALVLVVVASFVTAWEGRPAAHLLAGQLLLVLLLFRLAWGVVGSETARLGQMLPPPGAVLDELARFGARGPDNTVGHGAIGGWLAALMLALLMAQAGSGLAMAMAGIHGAGAAWLGLHRDGAWLLLGVIGLHLLRIVAVAVVKRHDLVRPMITGKKRLPAATPAPRMVSTLPALIILVIAAALIWLLALRF